MAAPTEAAAEHPSRAGHGHGHAHADVPRRAGGGAGHRGRLAIVLGLAAAFSIAELIGGWWTGSLALLADAFHLVSDVAALALSLFAAWMSTRPATARRTFGHSRAEILAALANGVALAAVAVFIVYSAIGRFGRPTEVDGLGVVGFGLAVLVYECVSLWLLHRDAEHNLNVRGAFLHVLSDALGTLGAILSGLAIWGLGWTWADPLAGVAISLLILHAAWGLVRSALGVLMESAPGHLDVDEIRGSMAALAAVEGVHDLHVWMIGSGEVCLSSHVVVSPESDRAAALDRTRALLRDRFAITHTTIQIETGQAAPGAAASDAECEGACS